MSSRARILALESTIHRWLKDESERPAPAPRRDPVDERVIHGLRSLQDEDENRTVVKDLIELFLRTSQERVTRIRAALAIADPSALALESHRLRSSSANLGAFALSRSAHVLEEAGLRGNAAGLGHTFAALET